MNWGTGSLVFVRDIRAIVLNMRAYSERILDGYNLGLPEKLILRYLADSGDVNQETIATQLVFDKSSVAKSIVKLEEQGLVQRCVDEQDRRSKVVRLTERASEAVDEIFAAEEDYLTRVFRGMTQAEVKAYRESTTKLAQSSVAMLEGVSG